VASHTPDSPGVEKHASAIFTKLDLPPSQAHHRRVLAVVTYLNC
jgi:hypothetical protein